MNDQSEGYYVVVTPNPIDLDAARRLAQEAQERVDAATPGPWYWGGHDTIPGSIDLRARVSGIPIVMAFRRWGMQGAEPCFWKRDAEALENPGWRPAAFQRAHDIAVRERGYRSDVVRLDNADAEFIATARAFVPALADAVRSLADEVERLRAQPCPHVVTDPEGTSYCSLAEGDDKWALPKWFPTREDADERLRWMPLDEFARAVLWVLDERASES